MLVGGHWGSKLEVCPHTPERNKEEASLDAALMPSIILLLNYKSFVATSVHSITPMLVYSGKIDHTH